MNKFKLLAIVSLAALAGCETIDQPKPMPVATPQVSAEGDWVDTSGIVSSFHSGTFTTRTTDSNQVLASGTYISTSPTLVEINMTSHVRNTQSKVNCQLVTASQLNCTSQTGAQFSLARRAPTAPPLAPLANAAAATTPATGLGAPATTAPASSGATTPLGTNAVAKPATTTPVAGTPAAATPATTTPATPKATTKKLPVLKPGASAKM